MDVKSIILKRISKNKEVRVSEIVKETNFSRAYVNRFFKELELDGKIVLFGRANKAKYVLARKEAFLREKSKILSFHFLFKNKDISEDLILDEIKKKTGIFLNLPKNIIQIIDYSFTEMLNNAIEHSKSDKIEVLIEKKSDSIKFEVIDRGVGIFNNIMKKRGLENELEAIQDLMKGKQTTSPKKHTGEGVFFTSKAGDILTIQSSRKKLLFNNILEDVFITNTKHFKGTKVIFIIGLKSKRDLSSIFKEYSGKSFKFSKTKVIVHLYEINEDCISRSQARRILSGMDKFETIILDFKKVETVGQAFADEVFRVWKSKYPSVNIQCQNSNENIDFMIKRSLE